MSLPMYRRHVDGKIGEAFQYGKEGAPWHQDLLTEVAEFVTGIDVDQHSTISADRILDVVQPVLVDWNHKEGKAPIQVADVQNNNVARLEFGDWIVRFPSKEPLVFVSKQLFAVHYEKVEMIDGEYKSQRDLKTEELAQFIYEKCFVGKNGPIYHDLADNTAKVLFKAGWRKVQS